MENYVEWKLETVLDWEAGYEVVLCKGAPYLAVEMLVGEGEVETVARLQEVSCGSE